MRHRQAHRALNRTSAHRRALLRNMVTALIEQGRILTTLPKAKELRSVAEKMVTLGKKGNLTARRQALAYVRKKTAVDTLFNELAKRFEKRPGGYTRIIKKSFRAGDQAPTAFIEYLAE